jgi:hypothetical protein
MKKLLILVLLVSVLALAGTAVLAAETISPNRPITIELDPQETVIIRCLGGDELIVNPLGELEAEVTCRVWVGSTGQ